MLILYVVDEDAVDTDEDKGIVTDGGVVIHNIERPFGKVIGMGEYVDNIDTGIGIEMYIR